MTRVVLDASACCAFLLNEEGSYFFDYLIDEGCFELLVPDIWHHEIVNVLRTAVLRGRLSAKQAQIYIKDLPDLVTITHTCTVADHLKTFDLSEKYSLATYDACYLMLAVTKKAQLCTLDKKLEAAARLQGVTVFGDTVSD